MAGLGSAPRTRVVAGCGLAVLWVLAMVAVAAVLHALDRHVTV